MIALLESSPLVAICVFVTLLILGCCELGFRLGNYRRKEQGKDAPTAIGPMVGGLLGMLGFLLAFTFSMAAAQHATRKSNVLEEANAIGTLYLRAELLPPDYRDSVKSLLREYVDVRLKPAASGEFDHVLLESAEIHKRLWALVSSAAIRQPDTNSALVLESTNEVIDMHERRVTGAEYNRIPSSVWIALAAITICTMLAIGLQIGFAGRRRFLPTLLVAVAFAALVSLVVDLNRPASGLITVGQDSMLDLQSSMDQDVQ